MNKAVAILKLTRIEHSLMLIVAVLSGELLTASRFPSLFILIASMITPIFISMASFAINDYFDIEVDKKNKKSKRPLVSGDITPKEALIVTYMSLFIGIFASLFINFYAFAIAIIFGILAMLYSYKLKEVFLLGNFYVALSMVIPLIYGNFVVSDALTYSVLIISIMIFLAGVSREIHGTVRDYEGDKKRRVNSLPIKIGKINASIIAGIFYFVAIVLSFYLFFYVAPFYNFIYLILIILTDVLLGYISVGYIVKNNREFYDKARNLSLIAISIALFAILLVPITSGMQFLR